MALAWLLPTAKIGSLAGEGLALTAIDEKSDVPLLKIGLDDTWR
jgi:hypothetical protein